MNNVVAKFEKVSYQQYKNDLLKSVSPTQFTEGYMNKAYETARIPVRATSGSAGYDICSPVNFELRQGDEIVIPTALRCSIQPGWFMMIVPRSGLGFRFYTRLANTCGIVDSDYYYAENQGHIHIKLRRETNRENDRRVMSVNAGDAIAQAIFIPYGITDGDEADGVRTGGFGSTDKK